MELTKKLQLPEIRDFGRVISDSFTLIIRNWKVLLSLFLYYVMPIFLLVSFVVFQYGSSVDLFQAMDGGGEMPISMIISYIISYGGIILGLIVVYVIFFATAQAYHYEPEEKLTVADVNPYLRKSLAPTLIGFLGMVGLILTFGLLCFLFAFVLGAVGGVLLFFLLMFPLIYAMLPLSFLPYVMVHEQIGFVDAFKRCFVIIKNNWWNTFGVYFVGSIISNFISGIFILPAYIIFFVQLMSTVQSGNVNPESGPWFGFFMIMVTLGTLVSSIYTLSVQVLKYHDLAERADGKTIFDRIDNLGKKEVSNFENEGEY